jgi:hypothetical protein
MHGVIGGKLEKIDRPIGFQTDQMVADVLKDVAKALWPKNTASALAAQIIGPDGKPPDPRTIERYFQGSREWSGDAIAAIVSEILKRHSMRNVRITPKR